MYFSFQVNPNEECRPNISRWRTGIFSLVKISNIFTFSHHIALYSVQYVPVKIIWRCSFLNCSEEKGCMGGGGGSGMVGGEEGDRYVN